MNLKQIDTVIQNVKLSGQLLVGQFADLLGIEASVLNEKVIDDSDLYKDVDLHFKMQKQLRFDLTNSNISINERKHRVESVLTFNIKYLNDLENLLNLAKHRKLDQDIRWKITFENLKRAIDIFKEEVDILKEYLQYV